MGFKIDKRQLKPVLTEVAAGAAGYIAAGYAEPELKKVMGEYGQYSDEAIAVSGTLIAVAAAGKKSKNAGLVRDFGIGVAVKGVLGMIDKYIFKRGGDGMQAPALPQAPLALASPLDAPVEVIDWPEEEETENQKIVSIEASI